MTRTAKPWEFIAPGLFLFILPFAHTTPFRLVCLGVAIVSIALTIKRRVPARLPPASFLVAFGFWFAVCLAASIASIEPEYSWGEFRNEVLVTTAAFCIFYWMTDSDTAWRRWQTILLASFCTIAVIAIFSYQRDGNWLRGSLVGDRNAFSTYIVLMIPFLLMLWVSAAGLAKRYRAGIAAALLLAFISGAFTQNRNLWFAIAAEIVAFAVLVLFRQPADVRQKWRSRYLAAGVIGVLAFTAILAYVVREKALVSNTSAEAQVRIDQDPRLEIWAYAVDRIGERPWFGYGYGRGILRKDFRTHFDNPLKWHGHNIVVNYALEAGVVGVVAIVGLFAALVLQSWRIYRSRDGDLWRFGAWMLAMLIGIILKMMTDDILVRDNAILFWSITGMTFGLASRTGSAMRHRVERRESLIA